jgi:hypothetical protein
MKDIHEQVFAHPIAPPKIVGVCCIVGEVVVVQHSMTLQLRPRRLRRQQALLHRLAIAIHVYEANQVVRNMRRQWGQRNGMRLPDNRSNTFCAHQRGEEWPPHSGQSRRTTGGEKGDEGARHHGGVQRSLSIASVVASDLTDGGGVGGEGEETRRERKAQINGTGYGRWQVGTHVDFHFVRRYWSVPYVA